MKKIFTTIIALILCCSLLAPSVAVASASGTEDYFDTIFDYVQANEEEKALIEAESLLQLKIVLSKLLNFLSNFFINDVVGGILNMVIPDSVAVLDYEEFDIDSYENFYAGMDEFIDEPQGAKVWSLGYGKASVLPEDFGSRAYAKGAYLPYVYGKEMYKDDDGNDEDLMARAIVMDDGSGRGKVLFIAIDAMGLANADVRLIREGLQEIAEANDIVSINVSCTHIHTGIDSQGIWSDPVGVIINNIFTETVIYGVERSFIDSVVAGSKKAVEDALSDMTTGSLYYSVFDGGEYMHDRTAPISIDANIYKLEFVPFAAAKTPTVIATFGCHPESASYDWDQMENDGLLPFDLKFSADFIWYTEKVLSDAGYNFIFLQGNVSTATSMRGNSNDGLPEESAHFITKRYGYEIGYILLGMNLNKAERIALNEKTGDRLGIAEYGDNEGYTKWYDGLETVEAVKVKPVLNVISKQFCVRIENNVVTLLGKTSVADNLVLKDDYGRYYTVSEVGYLEIGDEMKVYMSPGETFTELLLGGDGAKGFELLPIREYTGEDIIIMDLMNDAAGYVANPANFVMAGLQYNERKGEFDSDTWCLISYGKTAATTFISSFYDIYDSVR